MKFITLNKANPTKDRIAIKVDAIIEIENIDAETSGVRLLNGSYLVLDYGQDELLDLIGASVTQVIG